MENSLEVLDKLLNNLLLHHAVVVLGVLTDHDGSLACEREASTVQLYMLSRPTVCAKAGEESSLQGGPDLVREVEQRRLDTEHEGHPLVVGGVGGRVTALHSLTT